MAVEHVLTDADLLNRVLCRVEDPDADVAVRTLVRWGATRVWDC